MTELLQDSGVDVDAYLARELGVRISRAQNAHFTTGTGTAQPTGIVTGAATGVTAAGTTAITLNELINLVHSLDPAYRIPGQCAWMMNDSTLSLLHKLRDDSGGSGLGRPVIEPNVQGGLPNTLLGHPIVINNDMANATTGQKSVLFGNFRAGYVIRDAMDVSVLRLDERYADFLQVGFLAFQRSDAAVKDTAAYKALVMA